MQGRCRGFSLIEAMVAALLLAVGLLGLAKLQPGLYQSARRDADRLHALNAAMRSYEQFASQALSRLAVDIPGQRRSHIAGTTYEIEQRLTRDGSLSRSRTRIMVALELKPQNLSARLLVQSLKLAKNSLTKKFKKRVGDYAKDMEDRYHKPR